MSPLRSIPSPVPRARAFVVFVSSTNLTRALALFESIFEHEDEEHRIFALCLDEPTQRALATIRMPQLVARVAAELGVAGDSVPAALRAVFASYPEVRTLVHLRADRYLVGPIVALVEGKAAVEAFRGSSSEPADDGLVVARRDAGALAVLEAWERELERGLAGVPGVAGLEVTDDVARAFHAAHFHREDVAVHEGVARIEGRPLLAASLGSLRMFGIELYGLEPAHESRVSSGTYRALVVPYVEALSRAAAWEGATTGTLAGISPPSALSRQAEFLAARSTRARMLEQALPHRLVELSAGWDLHTLSPALPSVLSGPSVLRRVPAPRSVPLASSALPKAPRVSALVSTYRAERVFRGCLEDLVGQTLFARGELEIVVVDSASPTAELEVALEFAARYPNVVVVRSEEREGVYMAWNRAASLARGRYLTNANTDDRHRPDALERLAERLDREPEVALVYADSLITREANAPYGMGELLGCFRWPDYERGRFLEQCHAGPHPMWRRVLHDHLGWFDGRYVVAGDYDMWLRFAEWHRFVHVAEPLGQYLKAPDSVEHANQARCHRETGALWTLYRARAGAEPVSPAIWNASEAAREAAFEETRMTTTTDDTRGVSEPGGRGPYSCTIAMTLPERLADVTQALESLVAATPRYVPHEVLLLVRRPSDEVRGLLEQLGGDVTVCLVDDDVPELEAFRLAADAAASEVLVLVDGETRVAEGWLDPLLRHLEVEGRSGAVAGRRVAFGDAAVAAADRIGAVAVRRELLLAVEPPSRLVASSFVAAVVSLFRALHAAGHAVGREPRSSVVVADTARPLRRASA